jgi:hypothetical protein
VEVALRHLVELTPKTHGADQPIVIIHGAILMLLASLRQLRCLDDLLALHLAEVGVCCLFNLHLLVRHSFTHSPTVMECL